MNNNKKSLYLVVFVVLVVVLVSVFVQFGDKSNTVVKVGVMLPLSGDLASLGEAARAGIEMAHDEMGKDKIELVFEDSHCKAADAVTSAQKLIAQGVSAIIGEICSSATLPVAPIANQNKIVLISPSASSPKITDAGDYVFRTMPSDLYQGDFGSQILNKDGVKKIAIIYSNEDYGVGLNKSITDNFTKLGGEVILSEGVVSGTTDLRSSLSKIKSLKPDAIFLAVNSINTGVSALKQIKELNLNTKIYSTESLYGQPVIDGAGIAVEGLTVISVSTGDERFVKSYQDKFSKIPEQYTAQGFDAYKALYLAIDSGAVSGEQIKNKLYDLEFSGATGLVDFDQNGDVAGGYVGYKVVDGKFE